jgi:hypothetical protein
MYDYTRPCLLYLGLFIYPFSLFYPLREAQVCVHYLENTILTSVINIGVLCKYIIQVHIYTRLLINICLSLEKYK